MSLNNFTRHEKQDHISSETIIDPLSRVVSTMEESSMFLSKAELQTLTGFSRSSAQAKALSVMDIQFKLRLNGTIVVLRSHVEKQFDSYSVKPKQRKTTPDFTMVM